MVTDHAAPIVHLHGDAHLEREGSWPHGVITLQPQSETLFDATRIGFPLQVVILVLTTAITTALTAYGAVTSANAKQDAANAAIRMDVALIRQMQTDQAKIEEYKTKLDDERYAAITRAVNELKARGEMTDLKVNNLRETVLTNQRR